MCPNQIKGTMKKVKKLVGIIVASSLLFQLSFSQTQKPQKKFSNSNQFSVMAGLIQPLLLKGGNIEITYYSRRMCFDYSHGFLLNMAGTTIVGDAKAQKLSYHLPYSTGFGIGYRLTSSFDIRIEPKLHSWEVYYEGENQNKKSLIKSYKTYSLGLGVYYRYAPFRKRDNWISGVTTSTSFRWWPNIGSSLIDNKFTYHNKYTEKDETLKTSNIGIAGSQFIFNISVGYAFGKKINQGNEQP